MKLETVILILMMCFLFFILFYYDTKTEIDEETFNSNLDLPAGYYTEQALCKNNCVNNACSNSEINGYCTDMAKLCFDGNCILPICGGGNINIDGTIYSANPTGYCNNGYTCENGVCKDKKMCNTFSWGSTSGYCFNGNTCGINVDCTGNKHCESGGTDCNISGYTCSNGECLNYVKSPNFSFGGYNTSNIAQGLSDSENKVFQNVDISTVQGNLETCKTACNNNVNCGAFTRSKDLNDITIGDCYLKRRFNDSKGNMLSNRYDSTQYAYNSWIKVKEYEKLNIKRRTDGKIFSLK